MTTDELEAQALVPATISELLLYGIIGDSSDGLDSKSVIERVQALGDIGDLTIRINSGGGYVFEGLAIYNFLAGHPARKTVIVDGVAASMASAVAMVGDIVRMPENALLMIHSPWNVIGGDADRLRKEAEMLDKVRGSLVAIYAQKTGLGHDRLIAMMEAETWLTASEARALGFADEISEATPQARLKQADLSMLRTIPQSLAAMRGDLRATEAVTSNNYGASTMPEAVPVGGGQQPAAKDRASAIRAAVRDAKLGAGFADKLINSGVSIEQARGLIIDQWAAQDATPMQINHLRADHLAGGYDDPAFRVQAMQDALVARLTGGVPSEPAREYMGRSIMGMATDLLEARGERTKLLSRDKILVRALHSTSDFPALLSGTGNRILLDAFAAAPSALKAMARRRYAVDFRNLTHVKLGEAPKLRPVAEGGEVTHGTRAEATEGYRVKTFARIFALSRNAIVNDDLNAFSDWTVAMGRAAAETEADELVELLTANAGNGVTIDDGNPLYDADHGNRAAAGGDISVETLGAARKAMRDQKGLDGVTPVNASARFLLVGSEKETKADQVLADISPATVADANPFSRKLELIVEPRLTGKAWRLFADPAALPVLEYAYLQDAPGPQLEMREGWNVLGTEFRVVLDFGCGVVDHRGTYLDPGA